MNEELTPEQMREMKTQIAEVSRAMASAMFSTSQDKRVTTIAALRLASGTAFMAGVDLHRVITLVMAFYREAEAQFKEKQK